MTTPLAFLDGIGFSEMLVIAFLSILVFGGKLPDALRNVGRSYAKFRKGLHDVSRPLRDEIQRATTLPADTFVPTAAPTPPPPDSTGSGPAASEPPAPYGVGVPAHGEEPAPGLALATASPEPLAPPARSPGRPDPYDEEPPPV